jgi:hypothetical protein
MRFWEINKKEELSCLFNNIRINSYANEYNPGLPIIKGINYDINSKSLKSRVLNALNEIESHEYFRPKKFENSRIYEYFGVRIAKKIAASFAKKSTNGSNYYLDSHRTLDSLINYEKSTRFNESVHLFSAACLSLSGLYPLNIADFYLIMIQRYNRARIVNTLKLALKELCEFQKLLKY